MKETIDIDIYATSRNGDRKIMQSIRVTSRPPSRISKWNYLSWFRWTSTKVIPIEDLSWLHFDNESRVQEKDQQSCISVFGVCPTTPSGTSEHQLLPIKPRNASINMFLWLFCGEGNTFVYYIFNLTISIYWKIVFVSSITCCYGSSVCFADSFVKPFNLLAFLYTTIAHFNCTLVKYFMQPIRFWKVLA